MSAIEAIAIAFIAILLPAAAVVLAIFGSEIFNRWRRRRNG